MFTTPSHNNPQSNSLQYSISSNNSQQQLNHQRLSDSLQYLDRIRSINKKVFNSQSNNNITISPLQKLIQSQKQITYIDNSKIYGIIKIQTLTNLKSKLSLLEKQQQSYLQNQHQLNTKNTYLTSQLNKYKQRQSQLQENIQLITKSLNHQKYLKQQAELYSKTSNSSLLNIINKQLEHHKQYSTLKQQFEEYKLKIQKQSFTHSMIISTQTQFYKPTIQITPFEPNLQEILKKLRQKQGQQISKPTLKEIVAQSLDAFVKELDSQYKLIHQQTIDLNNLRQINQTLTEQNKHLKKKLDQINIQQEKLTIFRNCMTEFLNDASQNVNKSIEAERIRKRIYQQLTEQQRNQLSRASQHVEAFNQSEAQPHQPHELKQLKIMKQNIDYLKKENIDLLKTIGEYQCKMKKVEKVLDEGKKDQIPDQGTVGQLVKMSKLVKQSIKSLLHQL